MKNLCPIITKNIPVFLNKFPITKISAIVSCCQITKIIKKKFSQKPHGRVLVYCYFIFYLLMALQVISVHAQNKTKFTYSVFPILVYDSDIGLGYGGKGTVKNIYHKRESFDLILFHSSKGEQWYVFTFSIPDFELRQGEKYPFSFDLMLLFNKSITTNFFGYGNNTVNNDFQFTKEYSKIQITMGHAFTTKLVGEFVYFYSAYSVYDFDEKWGTINRQTPGAGETALNVAAINIRWDTRDSQIHPHKGCRLFYAMQISSKNIGSKFDFVKHMVKLSKYQSIWKDHILAVRLWMIKVNGGAPFMETAKIGGGQTLRGYKADRFLDRCMALSSVEFRFPVYKKLGGVLFTDAGRVAESFSKFSLTGWHANWGAGLRYCLENFVVRVDIGHSLEGTRIFFNFGHVF